MDERVWKKAFTLIQNINISNHVKALQFKILHQCLATNELLFKMNIVPSHSCSFCMLYCETQEHLLFGCFVSKNFWFDVNTLWKSKCNSSSQIDLSYKTFGVLSKKTNTLNTALNIIILIGKAYLWQAKQKSTRVHISLFVTFLKNMITCYKQNTDVKLILDKFWS